jgi:hypothetical protein
VLGIDTGVVGAHVVTTLADGARAGFRPQPGKNNGNVHSELEFESKPAETDRGDPISEADDQGCAAPDIATGKERRQFR